MDELFEALVFLGVLSTASVSSKKEGVFFISVHGNAISPVAQPRGLQNRLTPLCCSQLHISKFRLLYLQIVSRTCPLLTSFLAARITGRDI